jgi:hypothetical protein
MRNYFFKNSKYTIVKSVFVVILFELFFIWLYIQRGINIPTNDHVIYLFLIIGRIVLVIWFVFWLISAFLNSYIISRLDPKAELEINNDNHYLLYTNFVRGEKKQAKTNFDDIYLLKYNKAKFVNLAFYEINYTEKEIKKKIIVSISLTDNLEKKIDKTIKFVKNEIVFFDKFPETSY